MRLKSTDPVATHAYKIMRATLDEPDLRIDQAMDRVAKAYKHRLSFEQEIEARNRAVVAIFILNGEN